MIGNVDLDLLQKTYQNASLGITALKTVLNKPENIELNTELQKHLRTYEELADRSRNQLQANGADVKEQSLYVKTMMKGNVRMNTLIDSSDSRIAEMVIRGSTMGITQMTKLIHASKDADVTSMEIAEEFISKEEENIRKMKEFL